MPTPVERLRAHLTAVYGSAQTAEILEQLRPHLEAFAAPSTGQAHERVSERDVILITYGDQIQEPGKAPLQSLGDALDALTGDFLSGVHILPFYPYTSDDGFSVVDYKAVNPAWGDWADVRRLGGSFRLMFDAVINHISAESPWFQAFRRGEAPYTNYFITVPPETDLSAVVRPRTHPLLTPVETSSGVKYVWTTFSADQVDLNYASLELLLEIFDTLLFYVKQGAQLIRLDAIGFMWKEIGTSCLHLPQVHALIKAMRALLDQVAPDVLLVTETNVPHRENISYFGDGFDEAQMVYNFTLPPLTLHAFASQDATALADWAETLAAPSDQTTFFNFMASHDGIGLRPLEGILAPSEVAALAERTLRHGGFVNYRSNPDDSQTPYELNIVYFDALNDPAVGEPVERQVDRFMASQAILLSMAGVPGVYVHSLFGSRNWREGVALTGQNRTINRRKFQRAELEAELLDPASIRHQVFDRYRRLIVARTGEAAFHPRGAMQVVRLNPALFSYIRVSPDERTRVLCLHNVTDRELRATADLAALGFRGAGPLVDLVSGAEIVAVDATIELTLPPYGVQWLRGA